MSKMPWIRLYREALHDPKTVTLSDKQHRAWINCLLIADDTGLLPPLRDVATHMRVTVPDAEQILVELIDAELIDANVLSGGRTYRIHAWTKRQYPSDSSTERSRKCRAKKRATPVQRCSSVDATPPDKDSDKDSESEADSEHPTQTEPGSKQLPPEQEAARASSFKFDLKGVGLGRVDNTPSIEAKREASKLLNVADVDPLIPRYQRWERGLQNRAADVDAHFLGSIATIFENAPPAVKYACSPLALLAHAYGQTAMTHADRPSSALRQSPLVRTAKRNPDR